ncbi:MAG: alanine racemase [Oscillospiraceae bacterium]|nr:alanine racemase [Oscillospiraceae bacterium]
MKNLVIDRRVIRNNIRAVKEKADGAAIYADLSANAYGMGLLEMARLLWDEGIRDFIVSDARDARQLREKGFRDARVMMLRSTADPNELEELLDLDVICTVGSYDAAVALNGIAGTRGVIADVQIKIDTGLGRYGFDPAQLDRVAAVYKYMAHLRVVGTFTTFACSWRSRRETRSQLDMFNDVLDRLEEMGFEVGVAHCCDSAALFNYDLSKMDARMDAVILDLALSGRIPGKAVPSLSRVGYIEAGLEEVGWYSKGHHIGAEHGMRIRKATKIAVLSVGYYHGFGVDRHKAERSFFDRIRSRGIGRTVRVNGKKARVLGNVGMQHTLVDVTDVDCTVGDVAVLDVDPVNVKGLPRSYI